MFDDFLKKSTELTVRGEVFAVATVVRSQAPSSGKQGDRAIVQADGEITGWIGGGCAQPVVVKESIKAMKDGKPRMVRISPSPDGSEEGVVDYTMTCHSGGALDVYIEPVLPRTQVVILGRSPIAVTLARLSHVLGYRVAIVAEHVQAEHLKDAGSAEVERIEDKDFKLERAKVTGESFIVVSTQGEGDEQALEQALQSPARYVAFVASKTKAGKVFEFLRGKGIGQARLDQVHAPAGLNIAAASPEEIAVSILAEIIQVRRSQPRPATANKSAQLLNVLNAEARDPICGMMVDTVKAKYKSQHDGKWVYFCCAGCKDSFDRQPEKYTSVL